MDDSEILRLGCVRAPLQRGRTVRWMCRIPREDQGARKEDTGASENSQAATKPGKKKFIRLPALDWEGNRYADLQ